MSSKKADAPEREGHPLFYTKIAGFTSYLIQQATCNVAHATKTPSLPRLKGLVDELNESYLNIKNLKENLGDIEL